MTFAQCSQNKIYFIIRNIFPKSISWKSVPLSLDGLIRKWNNKTICREGRPRILRLLYYYVFYNYFSSSFPGIWLRTNNYYHFIKGNETKFQLPWNILFCLPPLTSENPNVFPIPYLFHTHTLSMNIYFFTLK